MGYVLAWFVVSLVFGGLGAYIAGEKQRSGVEGFLLGLAFGPLGTLIEVMLPTSDKPEPKRSKVGTARRIPDWERAGREDPEEDQAADWLKN